MNKVILMGRLTRDPDVRYTGQEDSTAVARFSLAVDRRIRREGDKDTADFFNCTAFGRLGEFVEKYLMQGTKVVLTGRIQNDNYTNREGQRVFSVQIIAEEIEFAESKAASEQNRQQHTQAQNRQPAPEEQRRQEPPKEDFMNVPDDSFLPFT